MSAGVADGSRKRQIVPGKQEAIGALREELWCSLERIFATEIKEEGEKGDCIGMETCVWTVALRIKRLPAARRPAVTLYCPSLVTPRLRLSAPSFFPFHSFCPYCRPGLVSSRRRT